jgi:hypothetical protein
LRLFSTLADYEYVSYETIPPSNIVNMEKIWLNLSIYF